MDRAISNKKNQDETIFRIDAFLDDAIKTWKVPGAVILLGKDQHVQLYKEYGYAQTMPFQVPMRKDSIFDIASLTKVVAAWPAIMLLVDQKIITLQHKVSHFYNQPVDSTLKDTTILELLTHRSGLSERTYLKQYGHDKDTILQGILTDGLKYHPNERVKYSNRGFVLLGDMIEKVAGMNLDTFLKVNIWEPLGMKDTTFNPDKGLYDRIVATEYIPERKSVKRGIVHDENAELLGGIAAHAGTFSTVSDVGKLCNMILHGERSIFSSELITHSFHNYTEELNEARGLAWQIYHKSKDSLVVGHYGFTGTTVWIDLKRDMYMILFTNRVHPSRDNSNIQSIRAYLREELFYAWI